MFDLRNDDFDHDFEKGFKKMYWMIIIGWVISAAVSLSMLAFIGWVIVRLLSHFGVI